MKPGLFLILLVGLNVSNLRSQNKNLVAFDYEAFAHNLSIKRIDSAKGDVFIYRVWITPTLSTSLYLINIESTVFYKETTIRVYEIDKQTQEVISQYSVPITKPNEVIKFLTTNNYSVLPNYSDLGPKMEKTVEEGVIIDPISITDGVNYCFQFRNQYSSRQYVYHCPYAYKKEYPKISEFTNVVNIINYLTKNLTWDFKLIKC